MNYTTALAFFLYLLASTVVYAEKPKAFPRSILGVQWDMAPHEVRRAMSRARDMSLQEGDSIEMKYQGGKLDGDQLSTSLYSFYDARLTTIRLVYAAVEGDDASAKRHSTLLERLSKRHGQPTNHRKRVGDYLILSEWFFGDASTITLSLSDSGVMELEYSRRGALR